MDAVFNYEYVMTDGCTLEGVKTYCSSRYCYGKNAFFEQTKDRCQSYRDGKCMVLRMMEEEDAEL